MSLRHFSQADAQKPSNVHSLNASVTSAAARSEPAKLHSDDEAEADSGTIQSASALCTVAGLTVFESRAVLAQ